MATWTVNTTADDGSVVDNKGPLRAVIAAAASGDTIVFDPVQFPANTETTIELSSYLSLPQKTLTFDGGETWTSGGVLKTRVVLDGQNAYQIIRRSTATATDYRYTFSGLTFANAYASSDGTAILPGGGSILTVSNCVFSNCETTTSYGGNVSVSTDCTGAIQDCYFTDCKGVRGVSVFVNNGATVLINRCIFNNCIASNSGNVTGGYLSYTSTTTIKDCTSITTSDKSDIYIAGANTTFIFEGTNNFKFVNFAYTPTIKGALIVDTIAINIGTVVTFDGVDCVLTVKTSTNNYAATFETTQGSTGYIALYDGANVSNWTIGTGITSCVYGADLLTFSADVSGATWTATNISTPILIEKQNGSAWTALTANATGGSYSTTFAEGDTARGFDGAKFLSFTIPVTPPPASYKELTAYTTIGYLKTNNSIGYLN